MTDEELVRAARRGDKKAFVDIVARHQAMVCGIALGVLRNFAASEDAAQEAFLTAWQRFHDLRDPAKLRPWLAQIARNAALQSLRRQRREAPLAEAPVAIDEAPTPDEALASEEEAIMVRTALARLPENYRLPLVLFYRDGQSVRRVAEALSLSEDAVKQRLARGREMLREGISGLVENVLTRSGPTTAFTIAIAVAIGALAVPATVAAGVFGAAAATAGTASATSSSTLLTAMSTSKTFLFATLVAGVAFIPIGYHAHSSHTLASESSNAAGVVQNPGEGAKSPPSFQSSAIFAEWKQLHDTYGTTPESMPGIYRAINAINDTTRRRAFQAALFAEWAQLDPRGGMNYLQSQVRDRRQGEQFFQEWISRDPGVAVDFLLEGGTGWHVLARASLNEIARRAPERLAETASRLPKEAGGWWNPMRKAFAIMGEVNPDAARQAAEAVTGPNGAEALAGAAAAWARTDLGAAIAWAKALPGKLDRDEIIRGALVGKAFTDPAAALDQLGLVPPGGRQDIFADTTGARVLRSAAAADYDATTAWIVAHPGRLHKEDMMGLADAVSERLNADPSGFLTRHAADSSLATILPAIGSALLNESEGQRAEVWEWLKQQPDSPTAQSLRNTLLNRVGYEDPDYALKLAGEITSGPEGDKQLSLLAHGLLNGGQFLDRFDGLLAKAPERFRQTLVQSAFETLRGDNMADPNEWIARLEMLPDSSRAKGARSISVAWADQAPEAALNWAGTLDEKLGRDAATGAVLSKWVARDSDGAIAWVNAQPHGEERANQTRSLANVLAMKDPQQAWNWAVSLDEAAERLTAASYVVDQLKLAGRVPAKAPQWIEVAPFTAAEKSRLQNIMQGIRKSKP